MKKFLCMLFAAVMVLSLAACGNQNTPAASGSGSDSGNGQKGTPTYSLKLSHCMSTNFSYHKFAEKFAEIVSEKTNGDVEVVIYPASQLGGERESCEAAQLGTLDIAITAAAPLANFSSEFEVFNLPFLFEDREHAHKYLDSEYGDAKLASLESAGLVGLAFGENEFFDWFTTFEATEPSDFQGKSIRCMENNCYMAYLSAIGANPVPMAWSEVPAGLTNGTIDGTCLTLPGTWDLGMYKGNYFIKGDVCYGAVPMVMSKLVYDSLPAEYQEIMHSAAKEAAAYERQWITDNEESMLKEMQDAGLTYIECDRDAFIDVVVDKVYGQLVGDTIKTEDITDINSFRTTDPVYVP